MPGGKPRYTFAMPETLGIFGGTFDPPHLGHLILAAEALQQLQLTRVLWVLTPQPPHKPGQKITSLRHRQEMLSGMLAQVPGFELSMSEAERPGPHYTIETLRLLQKQFSGDELVLLIGEDSLRALPTWYQPAEIIAAVAGLGVMRRPGAAADLDLLEAAYPGISAKIRFVGAPQLEISSSTIRQRIVTGGHFQYYLHPQVYAYIQRHQLYR